MPVSNTSLVERIARVIAGRMVSANAEGGQPSAGPIIDSVWRNYREDALSVIRTLREPDPAMAEPDPRVMESLPLPGESYSPVFRTSFGTLLRISGAMVVGVSPGETVLA